MRLRFSVVLVVLGPALAAAQCPAPSGARAELASRPVSERMGYLSRALDTDAANTRTWRLAWGTTYALGTLGQIIPMPLLGPEDQKDFVVGVLSTASGVAFTLIGTPAVMEDAPLMAARVAAGGDECALLADLERLVVTDAANEMSCVAWYMHAANVAFNLGLGLIIGLGFGHWVSALINFVAGAAVGEATLFTQPAALDGAWKSYLDNSLTSSPSAVRLSPLGGGFALAF
jgi:hypothetical protein